MSTKPSTHPASSLRKIAAACAAGATALLVVPATAWANNGIEGVWRVTRHGVDCESGKVLSTFPAIMSFEQGGALGGYAVGPGSTPAMGSPDYGRWRRDPDSGNILFRFLAYNYDADGAYVGWTKVVATLVLSDDAQSFTYKGIVRFYDASDNRLFSVCGEASATRFR